MDIKFNLSYIPNDDFENMENFEEVFQWNDFPENFVPESKQDRIMIIGDSQIRGIGFHASKRFSNMLLDSLRRIESDSLEPVILDLSKSGNNLIENYLMFNKFKEKFKPHKILWFHNVTDVLAKDFTLIFDQNNDTLNSIKHNENNFKIKYLGLSNLKNSDVNIQNNSIRKIIDLLKKNDISFKLFSYLKNNIYNKLLSFGFLIPSTKMHYVFNYAYLEDSKEFFKFKSIFDRVNTEIKKEESFIFYLMPRFNIIHRAEYFKLTENSIKKYFKNKKEFKFVNGRLDFENIDANKLTLVQTDSHPNAYAHKIILNKYFDIFKKKDLIFIR